MERVNGPGHRQWQLEEGLSWRPIVGLLEIDIAPLLRTSYPAGVWWQAGLAQLVEHLICNQGVGGSSPSAGTSLRYCGSAFSEKRSGITAPLEMIIVIA